MYILPDSMIHAEQKEEQCEWVWSEPNTALELVHNTSSSLKVKGVWVGMGVKVETV